MSLNLSNVKKSIGILEKSFEKRKYSVSKIRNLVNNLIDENYNLQYGGLDNKKLLEELNKFKKKIEILGQDDFKNLLENLEEMMDIFSPPPTAPTPTSQTP